MQRRCLLSTLLFLWLLQGCQANQINSQQPQWINGYLVQYPVQQYICGKGLGASFEIAKTNAMADLASFFDATVSSSINIAEQESSQTSKRKTTTATESYFASQVKVLSTAKLQFAEVAGNWQDPDTKAFHVLVVMDRRKLCLFYQDRIRENGKLMVQYMQPTDDFLLRYANLVKATTLSTENDQFYVYQNGLAVWDYDRIEPPYSTKELKEYMLQAGKNIRFNITVSGDDNNTISTALTEAIQKLGFSYGKESALEMIVSVKAGNSQMINKQYFIQYSSLLQISRAGVKLFEIKDEVRQGDANLTLATARTLRALGTSLANKFKTEFSDYFAKL